MKQNTESYVGMTGTRTNTTTHRYEHEQIFKM